MRTLLRDRDRRELKRDVTRLSLIELQTELLLRGYSAEGPEECVRDRMLRALFREREPENDRIPWYPWDQGDGAREAPVTNRPSAMPEKAIDELKRRGRPSKKASEQPPAQLTTSTASTRTTTSTVTTASNLRPYAEG